MDENPRRWFAFRLRTLFVLIAVAVPLLTSIGHQLNWVRERRALLDEGAFWQLKSQG